MSLNMVLTPHICGVGNYQRSDSNRHPRLSDQILSLARLPITPRWLRKADFLTIGLPAISTPPLPGEL